MQLQPNEVILIGSTYFKDGKVCKDSIFIRIEELISTSLIKIKTDESGWIVIYQDPIDSRYWELSYTDSHLHGGGCPTLKCISLTE